MAAPVDAGACLAWRISSREVFLDSAQRRGTL